MAGSLTIRELITRYAFKTDTTPIAKLDAAVAGLKTRIGNVDSKIIGAFTSIAKYTAVGAAGFAAAAVKLASSAGESEDMFQAVFKDMAGTTRAWSDDLAKSMGRNSYKIREFAANLQDTFVPLGFSRETAAELSKNLVELGMDVASFKDRSEPEVIHAFTSALVGNSEAVKGLGLAYTEEDLKAKIKELSGSMAGFSKMGMQQQKMLGRYYLLLQRSGDAHGNVTQTAGSFANMVKRLKARIEEVTVKIGMKLLPVVGQWIAMATKWIDANEELIKQKVGEALEGMVSVLKVIAKVVAWLVVNWKVVVAVVSVFVGGRILFGIASMAKNLWGIVGALKGVLGAGQAAASGINAAGGAASTATGGIGGLLAKVGAAAMAFKVGWDIGTKIDEWTGASEKWAEAMMGPLRAASKAKLLVYQQTEGYKRLVEQAQMYKDLAAKGIKSVGVEGGGRMELTQENIQKRLAALAGKLGMSPDAAKSVLPGLTSGPTAPGTPNGSKAVTVAPAQITVNVPPGTPASLAQRVAGAAGDATTRSMRNALGDVTR